MKKIVVELNLEELEYKELSERERKLVDRAKQETQNSYAPYSQFNVGAAVLLENGEIVGGSNQENAAYPSGMCAERVAMFYANAKYPKVKVVGIAIAAYAEGHFTTEPITPCGGCRQVLLETEDRFGRNIPTLLYGTSKIIRSESVKVFLPLQFGKSNLAFDTPH